MGKDADSLMLTHFGIKELVHPDIFNVRGDKSWQLLDRDACLTLDQLRKRYGRITVNNWSFGGSRKYSGLRPFDGPYSKFSQHKFGRAFDCLFADVTAEEVRQELMADNSLFPLITAIEHLKNGEPISWFHFDTRQHGRSDLMVFNV